MISDKNRQIMNDLALVIGMIAGVLIIRKYAFKK